MKLSRFKGGQDEVHLIEHVRIFETHEHIFFKTSLLLSLYKMDMFTLYVFDCNDNLFALL